MHLIRIYAILAIYVNVSEVCYVFRYRCKEGASEARSLLVDYIPCPWTTLCMIVQKCCLRWHSLSLYNSKRGNAVGFKEWSRRWSLLPIHVTCLTSSITEDGTSHQVLSWLPINLVLSPLISLIIYHLIAYYS